MALQTHVDVDVHCSREDTHSDQECGFELLITMSQTSTKQRGPDWEPIPPVRFFTLPLPGGRETIVKVIQVLAETLG